MEHLGKIELYNKKFIIEVRKKVYHLALALQYNSFLATQITAVFSEVLNRLIGTNSEIQINFELRYQRELPYLQINTHYQYAVSLKNIPGLRQVFNDVLNNTTNDSTFRLVLKKPITDQSFKPSNSFIKNVASKVSALSKEELLLELQEKQSALIEAKKNADAANEAKTKFLSNMSHEIRSPLNAIIGFSEILKNKTKKEKVPAVFEEYLDNIVMGGRNLSAVINDILDLSKIEAGKMELSIENMDLEQLIRSLFHINKGVAIEKGITLRYQYDKNLPKLIESDRTKLNQILMNLLSNALKFTKAGKEVTLEAKAVKNEQQFMLIVTDQGVGIPENRLQGIFLPFEQVDASTTREYGGTGLGLAITKKIVELLGGSISVTSEEHVGTCFTVCLPLVKADSVGTTKSINFDSYTFDPSNKILAVEDNPLNRAMLKALLEEINLTAEFAVNGMEGIEKIKKLQPDLVLMDIHMPVLDGFEAVKTIRSFKAYDHIPIVALSADAFKERQQKALKIGFNEYLTKPVEIDKLFPVLIKYLKGHKTQKDDDKAIEVPKRNKSEQQKLIKSLKQLENIPIFKTEEMIQQLEKIKAIGIRYTQKELESFRVLEELVFSGNSEQIKIVVKSLSHG